MFANIKKFTGNIKIKK